MSKDVTAASRGRRGGRGVGNGRGQNWGGPANNWGGMYIFFLTDTINKYFISLTVI